MRRALLTSAILIAGPASAHFALLAPAGWWTQDVVGSPQKMGPCGDEVVGGTQATGAVTVFHPGDQITVTTLEIVEHPGHYRISLGYPDRYFLPPEPGVDGGTFPVVGAVPCGYANIESPAVFPVLADDVWDHGTMFLDGGLNSYTVTLPNDITCTKCTLQIIEFMSQHGLNNPGGCFYHHCADISILLPDGGLLDAGSLPDAGSTGTDAGSSGTDSGSTPSDAGTGTPDAGGSAVDSGSGSADGGTNPPPNAGMATGGCSAVGLSLGVLLLASLALVRRRRR